MPYFPSRFLCTCSDPECPRFHTPDSSPPSSPPRSPSPEPEPSPPPEPAQTRNATMPTRCGRAFGARVGNGRLNRGMGFGNPRLNFRPIPNFTPFPRIHHHPHHQPQAELEQEQEPVNNENRLPIPFHLRPHIILNNINSLDFTPHHIVSEISHMIREGNHEWSFEAYNLDPGHAGPRSRIWAIEMVGRTRKENENRREEERDVGGNMGGEGGKTIFCHRFPKAGAQAKKTQEERDWDLAREKARRHWMCCQCQLSGFPQTRPESERFCGRCAHGHCDTCPDSGNERWEELVQHFYDEILEERTKGW